MPFERTVARGGPYNRLADPAWQDPLDISFSKVSGGRWNPPGAFGALYLNKTLNMARTQAAHKLAGQPYDIEDLDPSEQHDLVDVVVPEAEYLDCVTDDGLVDVGLNVDYPAGANGKLAWASCQGIGQSAFAVGRSGVACRSAAIGAPAGEEELAVFEGEAAQVRKIRRRAFADWYFA